MIETTTPELARVRETLAAIQRPVASEAKLQGLVASALAEAGVAFSREVDLGAEGRIDFLTAGGIGIEVKIAGGRNEVLRQLLGYAQVDAVRGLVLYTTRSVHSIGEETLNGKPAVVVRSRGWL
jgi:hypothetical protein